MTREQAFECLRSGTSHERLKAARFLAQHADNADLLALQVARQKETVSYVRKSLELALDRLSHRMPVISPDPQDEPDIPTAVRQRIYNQAVEWIAGLLLHEVASSIGLAKRAASQEISGYEHSKTKDRLEVVDRIFEAIEQLKGAAAVPRPQTFDLADLIAEIVNTERGETHDLEISLVGAKPLLVTSDPALIRFGICNGVRNAIEAVAAVGSNAPHPIVISWGETDVDYWVSIVDQGSGIVGSPEAAFEIGTSTKGGHSGFGLAIARRAMETLCGSVVLVPAAQGGARYEARWER